MSTFSIDGIAIKGISCCVPEKIEYNTDLSIMNKDESEKYIQATGVKQRRITSDNLCTSDLCLEAAKNLIKGLKWENEEIEILIFISQTPDYILPSTATILQHKLNLPKSCLAFDLTLGCSGYVYGLSVISSLMKASKIKKGLLLAGDTISKIVSKKDKSTYPLFGDAGSATGIELLENSSTLFFDLGSDGEGYQAIIVPDGGSRNKFQYRSLESKMLEDGIERNNCNLKMEGMDVFSFGITQVPKNINNLLRFFNIEKDKINYFIFHQANMMMNQMIVKKLKLPAEKVPFSLNNFGNTSSASIPLTIVSELNVDLLDQKKDILLSGFGVGLSWGSVFIKNCRIGFLGLTEIN
jgi:3-oxoacyl-[acyl-carrier-protein] synthase-3